MKKNVVAATPFASTDKLKAGQVIWITDGQGKPWKYEIVSVATLSQKDAYRIASTPGGNKRVNLFFPAGDVDTKSGAYTKRTVVVGVNLDALNTKGSK